MKRQLIYSTIVLAPVVALALTLATPVTFADDCRSRCATQKFECEDDAWRAYRRCLSYGEESACYQIYQRQLDVCEREHDSCKAGC